MNTSRIYIIISIAALVFIVILFLAARKKGRNLTSLVGFAWALVLTGIVPDQPALHGILAKINDLGLSIISVTKII